MRRKGIFVVSYKFREFGNFISDVELHNMGFVGAKFTRFNEY